VPVADELRAARGKKRPAIPGDVVPDSRSDMKGLPVAKKKAAKKATKKTSKKASKKTAKKATKKQAKNSLVGNINKRKKAGTSRSKAKSTISKKAYRDMQEGWPDK
jgi:hypothetical protein